jgi:hypothetical protein
MPEPTIPATVADQLRAIADDIETVDLDGLSAVSVTVNMQPCPSDPDDLKIATVDAFCLALTDSKAATTQMVSGSWHHTGSTTREPVRVAVFTGITDPKIAATYAEVARLRAELATARTELAGTYHPAVGKQTQGTATPAFPHIY